MKRAIAAIATALALDAAAETWSGVPIAAGSLEIDVDSVAPAQGYGAAIAMWVRHQPTLSVECSPPRGCYANSQRIYYYLSCYPASVGLVERISMDLNGSVIKHETFSPAAFGLPRVDSFEHVLLRYVCLNAGDPDMFPHSHSRFRPYPWVRR